MTAANGSDLHHNGLDGNGVHDAVLIVDDDLDAASALCEALELSGLHALPFASGAEALDVTREQRPALVALEVCLPDVNGYAVCRSLREHYGQSLPIVFMSDERTDALDRTVGLMIGADDYLVKPLDHDEFVARVFRLVERSTARGLDGTTKGRHGSDRRRALTVRERQVLQLLAAGKAPNRIADELVVSPKTVSNHMQRVFAKLGVHSQAQAVAVAYRDGLIDAHARAPRNEPLVTS